MDLSVFDVTENCKHVNQLPFSLTRLENTKYYI